MSEKPKPDNDPTLVELPSKGWEAVIAAGYVIASVGMVGIFVSCMGFSLASADPPTIATRIAAVGMTGSMFVIPFGLVWAASAHIGRWWNHG